MKLPQGIIIVACLAHAVSASGGTYALQDTHIPSFWSPNTASLLDTIISRGYLKVGTTGDYKHYSYLISNNTIFPSPNTTSSSFNTSYIGADIDTARSLSNALSLPHPVQFIPTTWSNLTTDMLAGKFDIAMGGITITLPRAKSVFFSSATERAGKVACIRCADKEKYTSMESIDQPETIVVVNPGGTNEDFDRTNLKKAVIKVVADNNAVYQAVLDGEGDVMISDISEVGLQMKLHEGELCIVTGANGQPFDFDEKAYLLPRDIVWKSFVDLFVGIQSGSGSYNATLVKWTDFGWPSV